MILEPQWHVYGLLITIIASVHLWSAWFEFRTRHHRKMWIGIIGGISLGYVCLYMLPKLSAAASHINLMFPDSGFTSKYLAYYILLGSILLFLGMEKASEYHKNGAIASRWLHMNSHGLYCFLIGYVAVELPLPKISLHVLANVILAAHLLGMIIHLRENFPGVHDHRTRWLFSALVVAGSLMGIMTQLPVLFIMMATSFVAGFILVNVIADELPRRGEGELHWFLMGAGLFGVTIIFLQPG